jgi:transposase
VRVEDALLARARSGSTGDFEDLVAFLATKTDKTTITRGSRVHWDSVGRIGERIVADGLDPTRLDDLACIEVDEVSWRRQHHCLTLVPDHAAKKTVWGAPGKDAATLDRSFTELGGRPRSRTEQVTVKGKNPILSVSEVPPAPARATAPSISSSSTGSRRY